MQALAGVAYQFRESTLDVEVNVLQVDGPMEDAVADLLLDGPEAATQRLEFLGRQNADVGQHVGMRQRTLNVDHREPLVEPDRRRIAFDEVRHRFGEAG